MALKAVIIDDDKIIRKTLEKYLTDLDFSVSTADQGSSGLELVEMIRPDLVISDMLMPGTHGIEICNIIKQSEELSGIKVILMSSLYKRSDTMQEELDCEYDGFLEKPFDFNQLVSMLHQINLSGFK